MKSLSFTISWKLLYGPNIVWTPDTGQAFAGLMELGLIQFTKKLAIKYISLNKQTQGKLCMKGKVYMRLENKLYFVKNTGIS